jgi:hypothetical protein
MIKKIKDKKNINSNNKQIINLKIYLSKNSNFFKLKLTN